MSGTGQKVCGGGGGGGVVVLVWWLKPNLVFSLAEAEQLFRLKVVRICFFACIMNNTSLTIHLFTVYIQELCTAGKTYRYVLYGTHKTVLNMRTLNCMQLTTSLLEL